VNYTTRLWSLQTKLREIKAVVKEAEQKVRYWTLQVEKAADRAYELSDMIGEVRMARERLLSKCLDSTYGKDLPASARVALAKELLSAYGIMFYCDPTTKGWSMKVLTNNRTIKEAVSNLASRKKVVRSHYYQGRSHPDRTLRYYFE
jgi:hypothetical protein